jgi:AcrR family transcriptional regulator
MVAVKKTPPEKAPRQRVVQAALDLAAGQGWADVTFADIAAAAAVPLADLQEMFEDKADIIAAYGRMLDRAVVDAMGPGGAQGEDPRERLFDVLMERFDLLNDDRAAITSIVGSFRADPKELVISFPHLGRTMARMAQAAGVDTTGVGGAVRVAGLVVVYLAALRVWLEDESPDLSKTMAALDRYLDRAGQLAGTFGL